MDLNGLEEEYARLHHVIRDNLHHKASNLWQVCFHWWCVYKKLNEQLENAKNLDEKDEIIAGFAKFMKHLSQEVDRDLKESGLDANLIIPLNDQFDRFSPHMQEMILVMRRQRDLFIKRSKEIKTLKERGEHHPHPKKRNTEERGWLKS